jgi:hypothetical protein
MSFLHADASQAASLVSILNQLCFLMFLLFIQVLVNDDSVGRSVDETLRLISAFRHADSHGVVCPANWQPGSKTIVPDQNAKLTFFNQAFGDKKTEL